MSGPAGWDGLIINADGSPDVQAGSHPYAVTTTFNLNETADSNGKLHAEGGDLKDLEVEVPPGLIGDINAVPICSELEFFTLGEASEPECSNDTVLGVLDVRLGSLEELYVPVFNLQPAAGVLAEWGAMIAGHPIIVQSSVRSGSDYGVTVSLSDISQALPVTGSTLTIWGVPADPSHDPFRGVKCLDSKWQLPWVVSRGCSAEALPDPADILCRPPDVQDRCRFVGFAGSVGERQLPHARWLGQPGRLQGMRRPLAHPRNHREADDRNGVHSERSRLRNRHQR